MWKGLRLPVLALVMASGLLILALATRPEKTPDAAPATPSPRPTLAANTLAATPLPAASPVPPAAPAAPENILVEALVGKIVKLNPLLATYNPVDRDITSLIFEGLTATNDYGEIVPDLAKSWTVSGDGLQYVVTLRDDVLWQDGLPFTAGDVVFTFDVLSDPLFPGAAVLHDFWKTVEVDALGEHLVRFRLTQPLASFPDQLRIGIVPAHVLEGAPEDQLDRHPFNLSPIGTGPYQIEALTATNGEIDGIQLRVAPDYRLRPEGREGFALDRVVFRTYPTAEAALAAFQQGEVNSIGSVPLDLGPAAQQVPGLSLYPSAAPRVGVLLYNWERSSVRFVRNQRVRLALAHAFDRLALVQKYLAGRAIPADSPLLPGCWAYEPGLAWPAYDLVRAQALMDTADLVLAEATPEVPAATAVPDGQVTAEATEEPTAAATEQATEQATAEPEAPLRLALTILVVDDPALVALANDIAAGWAQIGFETSIEAVDAAALQARLEAGDFDAALVEFSFEPSADPDPYVFWHQGQYGVGQNYGGMDDRRISEALEKARRDPYGINRVVYYHQFQELFAERAPALVLYYPLYLYAADTRLQGVQIGFLSSPADRFRHIQDWTFNP
jgi:peptide/nickel transport system substrate-binding protein